MNRKANSLYLFVLRMPFFLAANGTFCFLSAATFLSEDYIKASIIFMVQFISLFFAGELISKKAVRVVTQSLITLLSFIIAYIIYRNHALSLPVIIMIFSLFVTSLVYNTTDYKSSNINAWIFIITVSIFLLQFTPYTTVLRIFLYSLVISIVCKYLAMQMYSMDIFIHSYRCRIRAKTFINVLTKKSLKLVVFYLLLIIVFSLPLLTQTLSRDNKLITMEEAEQFSEVLDRLPRIQENTTLNPKEIEVVKERDELTFIVSEVENQKEFSYKNMLRKIMFAALIIAIFVFAILYNKKNKALSMKDEDPNETLEITDCTSIKKLKTRKTFVFSYNKAVRKIFINKVTGYAKKGLVMKKSSTAQTILSDISHSEPVDLLSEIYHKARYGDVQITKEEFSKIRKNKK